MANTSISGLTRSLTGSMTQNVGSVSSGSSAARAQASTVAASSASSGGQSGTASTANRQVVNVEGENYNRNARRGTYLNIVV